MCSKVLKLASRENMPYADGETKGQICAQVSTNEYDRRQMTESTYKRLSSREIEEDFGTVTIG